MSKPKRARRYISFEGFDRVARIDFTRTAPQRYESTGDGRSFGTSERQISNELDLRDLESKRGETICSGHYVIRKVPSEMEGYGDFWEVSYDGDHQHTWRNGARPWRRRSCARIATRRRCSTRG